MKIRFIALAVLTCACNLLAFNHPEIQWRTVQTEHFAIHYYDKTEPAVYATSRIAEAAFKPIADLYAYTFKRKINIALADYDDYSNGYASWTDRSIMIWIPDGRFELRGNPTWLNNVLVHELTHIISLEKRSALQLLDWSITGSYTSNNVDVTYSVPIALSTFFPQWFAEGLAQNGAQRMNSDFWDSRRDMVLRTAVLAGKQLTLDEMGHFNHDGRGREMVYDHGFSFVNYLSSRFGDSLFSAIIKDARGMRIANGSFEELVVKHLGMDIKTLYDNWIDSVRSAGKALTPPTQTTFTTLWDRGYLNSKPRISLGGLYRGWFTSDGDDFGRTDLIVVADADGRRVSRIPYAQGSWDFSADGKSVFYLKSRSAGKNGSFLNDIFCTSLTTGREERITHDARVYDIAPLADGSGLACTRFEKGTFSIDLFDLKSRKFSRIINGTLGEPFTSLSIVPLNDSSIIASQVVSGRSVLLTIDLKKKTVSPLFSMAANCESPFAAPDSRIYFSSDATGIYEIYSIAADGSELRKMTSSLTGLFEPVVFRERLVCSRYDVSGFTVAQTPLVMGEIAESLQTPVCSLSTIPQPKGIVRLKFKEYKADYQKPITELQSYVQIFDDTNYMGRLFSGEPTGPTFEELSLLASTGIYMFRADALARRESYFGVSAQAIRPTGIEAVQQEQPKISFSKNLIYPTRIGEVAHPFDEKVFHNRVANIASTLKEQNHLLTSQVTNKSAASNSTDTSEEPSIYTYLVPEYGFANRMGVGTYSLSLAAPLVRMIPAQFWISGSMEWQLSRSLFLGCSPSFTYSLFIWRTEQFALPLWVFWSDYSYLNTDVSYNRGNTIGLQAMIEPITIPYLKVSGSFSNPDSSIEYANLLATGVAFHKGFSLFHYCSIEEEPQLMVTWINTKLEDPLDKITGSSPMYGMLQNHLQINGPIWRAINRGKPYLDALYGAIFYDLNVEFNQRMISNGSAGDLLIGLTKENFRPNGMYVSHQIGLEFTLGTEKSYLFSRNFVLKSAIDLWRKTVTVNAGVEF